jgi:PAS domain-containing protein
LQIHQIELERQNEERRAARAEAETHLKRYTELYEFAPTGYFTLGLSGCIEQVNQAGLALLGRTRTEVLGRIFPQKFRVSVGIVSKTRSIYSIV